jgi:hypothetical protein
MIDSEPAPSGTSSTIKATEPELPQKSPSPTPPPTAAPSPEVPSTGSVSVDTILSSSQLSPPHIHTASRSASRSASRNASIFTSSSSFREPSALASSPSQMLSSSSSFTYTASTSDSSESALTSISISPTDQNSGGRATALHTIIGVSVGCGITLVFLVVGVVGVRLRYQRIQSRVKRRAESRGREGEKET